MAKQSRIPSLPLGTMAAKKDSASAQLVFPPSSAKVGKPYSIADHWAVSPGVSCRELIQNALDAFAAAEKQGGGGEQCEVSFRTAKLAASEIPDIDDYRSSLRAALDSWSDNESVRDYLKSIERAASEDEVDVLFVTDNGKGFDKKGLEAVLAEGTPQKQEGSSGSFGIGHLTAFGLSGLQYIFYLGKNKDGGLIAAGHTILSSFEGADGSHCSNHGYFLRDYKQTFSEPFDFCDEDTIPEFLLREADKIKGSGSIVAVLGFNGFRNQTEDDAGNQLSKLIREAVAENFAVAICSKNLAIKVLSDGGEPDKIDESSILDFLRWMAKPDTGTREATREAELTLDAIETWRNHQELGKLETPYGDCEIRIRNGVSNHNVSFWRNGMLITRRHSGMSKGRFDGKKPLNAIILLSGKESPRVAHDLVKKAETPLHDRIETKRLPTKVEQKKMRTLLEQIREWISSNAEESGGESSLLDDEIMLDNGFETVWNETRPPNVRKRGEEIDEGDGEGTGDGDGDGEGSGEGEGGGRPPKKRKVRVSSSNILPALMKGKMSDNVYRMQIVPQKDCETAIMEILVDSGRDPSCSGGGLTLTEVTVIKVSDNGAPSKVTEDGKVVLTELKQNVERSVDLTFSHSLPKGVSLDCRIGKAAESKVEDLFVASETQPEQ